MEAIPDTFPSLFGAYTVIWCIIAVYMFSLSKRIGKLEKDSSVPNSAGKEDGDV